MWLPLTSRTRRLCVEPAHAAQHLLDPWAGSIDEARADTLCRSPVAGPAARPARARSRRAVEQRRPGQDPALRAAASRALSTHQAGIVDPAVGIFEAVS